jgi:energy-coupling factor transporter ATP-binding protein EcfA2
MRLLGRGVRCVRGGREVFSGLDFEAASGEALAVTGRNGSGKTSLLRLIAGLLTMAGGSIGLEGGGTELTLPEQAHYLGHRDAMKPALSVLENLHRRAAGGVSVGRAAAAAFDRPPAGGAATDLAIGRADLGAGCLRAEPVCCPDERSSGARRPDHCRNPYPARGAGQRTANWGSAVTLQDTTP